MKSGKWIGLGILVAAAGCGGGGGGGSESQPAVKSWQSAEFVAAFSSLEGIPQMAALPSGEIVTVLAVNSAPTPGSDQSTVLAYHSMPSGSVPPKTLATHGKNPCLISDLKGNLALFWEEREFRSPDGKDDHGPRIVSKTKDVDGDWDNGILKVAELPISSDPNKGEDAVQVRAARNTVGSMVAVWKQVEWSVDSKTGQRATTALRIFAHRYDPTSVGSPREIRSCASLDSDRTHVRTLLHESGEALVAWTEGKSLYAAFLSAPSELILLDTQLDVPSVNGPPLEMLHLAAGPEHVLVLWGSPTDLTIRCARLQVPTRSLETIDIVATVAESNVSMALGGDGSHEARAVWSQGGAICSRTFDFAQKQWNAVERIREGVATTRYPAIAMNSSGAALVAWGENDALVPMEKDTTLTLSYGVYGRALPGGSPTAILADTPLAPRIVIDLDLDESGNGAALLIQLKSTSSQFIQMFLSRYR